jgi:protein SCO1/2
MRIRLQRGGAALARLACLAALALPGRAQLTVEQPDQPPAAGAVGVDEHLGDVLPADLAVTDDQGARHTLGELVDRPTVLIQVFYHCPGTCPLILGSIAAVANQTPFRAGEEFRILTVSFDDEDTAEMAQQTASNYLGLVKGGLPPGAWRFFTADAETIQKLLSATGFKVLKRDSHAFAHPNLVIVLSADRKIIRYLYGTEYLPMDLGMALSEAARGTPGVSIKKIMSYCFTYDAKNRRYAFNVLRVYGTVTLVLLGVFLFFLLRKKKETPPASGGN